MTILDADGIEPRTDTRPKMIVRQQLGQPAWRSRVVFAIWKLRLDAYEIDRAYEIPVYHAQSKRLEPLSRRSKFYQVIAILVDRVCAGEKSLPVLVIDSREEGGFYFVFLPGDFLEVSRGIAPWGPR